MLAGIEPRSEQVDPRARQQAAVLAFGSRTNARPQLSVLMQDAVVLVAEILQANLTGVGEVVADGRTLTLTIAAIGTEGRPVDPVVHKSSLDAVDSMAAYALNAASPIVTSELAAEKRFTDVFLRRLRVVSAMTVPLHLGEEPFGSLGVYSRQQREFTQDDVHFAETIAHLLTSSVARVKAEEALQQQRAFTSTVLETVDSLVLVLNAESKLVRMNRACEATAGFSIGEVRDKPFCNVFVVPEEIEMFQGIFRSTVSDKLPCQFEGSLLTKDGNRRSISWSLKVICDEHESVQSIMLAGTDRTEQLDAQRELEHTRKVAAETTRSLGELRQEIAAQGYFGDRRIASLIGIPGEETSGADDGETHQPFQPAGGSSGKDRRTSPRETYQYYQSIAPIHGGVIPSPNRFFAVACEDISAGGVAFCLDEAPDFEDLVVALGQSPALSYFTARIVRVVERVRDRKKVYLVGCRFTGRVYL